MCLGVFALGKPRTGCDLLLLVPVCLGSNASHGRRWHLLPPLAGLPGQAGIRVFSLTSCSWDMAITLVWQEGEVQLPKQ